MGTIVLLSKRDIESIKNLGYDMDFFVGYDTTMEYGGKTILRKRPNGWCVFLSKEQGIYKCEVYENRPKICRKYPFFRRKVESCIPQLLDIRR